MRYSVLGFIGCRAYKVYKVFGCRAYTVFLGQRLRVGRTTVYFEVSLVLSDRADSGLRLWIPRCRGHYMLRY